MAVWNLQGTPYLTLLVSSIGEVFRLGESSNGYEGSTYTTHGTYLGTYLPTGDKVGGGKWVWQV